MSPHDDPRPTDLPTAAATPSTAAATPSAPPSSSAATPSAPPHPSQPPFLLDPAKALALYRLRPGDLLSDYSSVDVEIQRVAHGGFGLVFIGLDHPRNRSRALKTLRPELLVDAAARSPDHLARLSHQFLREALTWVGLWPHPNLLLAQFATEIHGVLFLVLEYAPNGSLRDLLDQPEAVSRGGQRGQPARPGQPGRLPLGTALSWAQHIAAGLVALHTPDPAHLRDDPLVHRDLKPENVLLNEYGNAVITDFGLAKVVAEAALDDALGDLPPNAANAGATARTANTQSQRYQTQRGQAMGTLAYMAPEQWVDAASAGPPADLYALGLLLGELLTGRHALLDLDLPLSHEQWRLAHFQQAPRPLRTLAPDLLSLPTQLAALATVEALYQRLLTKRADDRPTAAEALAGLQQVAQALGADPYTPPEIPATPEHTRIYWQSWANTCIGLGLHDEALVRIDRALAVDPTHPQTLLNRGTCLKNLGRYAEALASYDASLAGRAPDDVQGRNIVQNQRGLLFSQTGRYAEADASYAAALDLLPKDAVAWYNRSLNQRAWAEQEQASGRRAEAVAHFTSAFQYAQHALQLNPNHPDYQRRVALAQQALDDISHP